MSLKARYLDALAGHVTKRKVPRNSSMLGEMVWELQMVWRSRGPSEFRASGHKILPISESQITFSGSFSGSGLLRWVGLYPDGFPFLVWAEAGSLVQGLS